MATSSSSLQGHLPRKLTAVATIGEAGASYTVYEKNWFCTECNHENYARVLRCQRCRNAKPKNSSSNLVTHGASPNCEWREAIDPSSQHIYYYNTVTKATQWERPESMGAAPHATGWFGRGSTSTSTKAISYEANNKRYLTRLARKQIECLPNKTSRLEGAFEYNIWYDKYIGDHWGDERGKEPAETRCVLETDAGKTAAKKNTKYFCMHFARGMCARGPECLYLHRLPTRLDEVGIGMMKDCFGRDRHATDRDDMSGTGNFTRNSRTLYVAGLLNLSMETSDATMKALSKAFEEWGEVENVNIIHRLSIAFVRYRHRISAEFAKEAMSNQALDNEEVLNIRWAFDDPNPVAKEAAQRSDHDAIVNILKSKGISTKQASFAYPEDYNLPDPKRQRIAADSKVHSYPDTDGQYSTSTTNAAKQLEYATTNDNDGIKEK